MVRRNLQKCNKKSQGLEMELGEYLQPSETVTAVSDLANHQSDC